ncbi:YqgE/AlgH family protein [Sphingomonas sp.]|uniref:YqgE/AlgH family protein n=1 Tax=Sphingomonas sp. TaxID=28214 RepID=UPI001ED257B8|nr:YqgE/AlgH family protein [Sphingomonas sp.]MBX3593879.1 YqgE/AlgH family protein [Sphingomonas sp.]
MESTAYLTGQILLAMPGIGDPRFERAVIAMCAHDAQGALGIGIGEVIAGLTFHELLGQFDIDPGNVADAPVHAGGPVEPRRGFVLHSTDWAGQDTIDVAGRWGLSGSIDVLRAIAEQRGPSRWLVALGYAGWGEGQLDGEMTRHGWFNIAGDAAMLFDVDTHARWESCFRRSGIDPRLLANDAGNA